VGQQVQAPIAVTSGTPVAITAKAFARYAEMSEDGSGAAAGLSVTWPNGNTVEYTPSQYPIVLAGTKDGCGPLVGVPANYNGTTSPATQYCTVESLGANTYVRVTEQN
jgi:hypothetical protein